MTLHLWKYQVYPGQQVRMLRTALQRGDDHIPQELGTPQGQQTDTKRLYKAHTIRSL